MPILDVSPQFHPLTPWRLPNPNTLTNPLKSQTPVKRATKSWEKTPTALSYSFTITTLYCIISIICGQIDCALDTFEWSLWARDLLSPSLNHFKPPPSNIHPQKLANFTELEEEERSEKQYHKPITTRTDIRKKHLPLLHLIIKTRLQHHSQRHTSIRSNSSAEIPHHSIHLLKVHSETFQ